jgi:HPt (histidine-containing phosphotransfer) domain-containing protein
MLSVRPSDPSRIPTVGPNPDKVLLALQKFKSEIPNMVETVISNLELQKKEFQQAFDIAHE